MCVSMCRQERAESKMQCQFLRAVIVSRWLTYLAFILYASVPRTAFSQTPSPLQEWQYPGGTILEKLFDPNLQDWRVVLGAAVAAMPR